MQIINKKTGEDVSDLYLKQMKGEITRDQFIEMAGLDPVVEAKELARVKEINSNPIFV